jgi:hypothetical protein
MESPFESILNLSGKTKHDRQRVHRRRNDRNNLRYRTRDLTSELVKKYTDYNPWNTPAMSSSKHKAQWEQMQLTEANRSRDRFIETIGNKVFRPGRGRQHIQAEELEKQYNLLEAIRQSRPDMMDIGSSGGRPGYTYNAMNVRDPGRGLPPEITRAIHDAWENANAMNPIIRPQNWFNPEKDSLNVGDVAEDYVESKIPVETSDYMDPVPLSLPDARMTHTKVGLLRAAQLASQRNQNIFAPGFTPQQYQSNAMPPGSSTVNNYNYHQYPGGGNLTNGTTGGGGDFWNTFGLGLSDWWKNWINPTPAPTPVSTPAPTTQAPTQAPTTQAPTQSPTTQAPTQAPTTQAPTQAPTQTPTTQAPTQAPTTQAPTQAPTTQAPTEAPTTQAPTEAPTTQAPTEAPTTQAPTEAPTTQAPSQAPTQAPTSAPTQAPPTPEPTPEPVPTPEPTQAPPTPASEPSEEEKKRKEEQWKQWKEEYRRLAKQRDALKNRLAVATNVNNSGEANFYATMLTNLREKMEDLELSLRQAAKEAKTNQDEKTAAAAAAEAQRLEAEREANAAAEAQRLEAERQANEAAAAKAEEERIRMEQQVAADNFKAAMEESARETERQKQVKEDEARSEFEAAMAAVAEQNARARQEQLDRHEKETKEKQAFEEAATSWPDKDYQHFVNVMQANDHVTTNKAVQEYINFMKNQSYNVLYNGTTPDNTLTNTTKKTTMTNMTVMTEEEEDTVWDFLGSKFAKSVLATGALMFGASKALPFLLRNKYLKYILALPFAQRQQQAAENQLRVDFSADGRSLSIIEGAGINNAQLASENLARSFALGQPPDPNSPVTPAAKKRGGAYSPPGDWGESPIAHKWEPLSPASKADIEQLSQVDLEQTLSAKVKVPGQQAESLRQMIDRRLQDVPESVKQVARMGSEILADEVGRYAYGLILDRAGLPHVLRPSYDIAKKKVLDWMKKHPKEVPDIVEQATNHVAAVPAVVPAAPPLPAVPQAPPAPSVAPPAPLAPKVPKAPKAPKSPKAPKTPPVAPPVPRAPTVPTAPPAPPAAPLAPAAPVAPKVASAAPAAPTASRAGLLGDILKKKALRPVQQKVVSVHAQPENTQKRAVQDYLQHKRKRHAEDSFEQDPDETTPVKKPKTPRKEVKPLREEPVVVAPPVLPTPAPPKPPVKPITRSVAAAAAAPPPAPRGDLLSDIRGGTLKLKQVKKATGPVGTTVKDIPADKLQLLENRAVQQYERKGRKNINAMSPEERAAYAAELNQHIKQKEEAAAADDDVDMSD